MSLFLVLLRPELWTDIIKKYMKDLRGVVLLFHIVSLQVCDNVYVLAVYIVYIYIPAFPDPIFCPDKTHKLLSEKKTKQIYKELILIIQCQLLALCTALMYVMGTLTGVHCPMLFVSSNQK